jgi:Ca-activated chloride channel family protein
MIRYENTEWWWAFLLMPIMLLFFLLFLKWRRNALVLFGDNNVVIKLTETISIKKIVWKFIFQFLAFIFLILAIINPQIGTKLEEVKTKGSEIIICLDVSNSMLAQDLQPNRLEMAKRALSQLVDKLRGDKIGIIIFAGKAYTQLPITSDYAAAKMFLRTINTNLVATQGTAIGSAIETAVESFNFNNPSGKAIIIISDGENHEDDAISATQEATSKNIVVHTIGFGSPAGTPIPIYKLGKQAGFRTDKEGNTIITKLNETMLQEIANAGNGTYIRANNSNAGLLNILEEIQKLEKSELGSTMYTDYEDRYQLFLAFAILFFTIELIITTRKNLKWNSNKIFERK